MHEVASRAMVSKALPPHAINTRPFLMTEREWAALPWEDEKDEEKDEGLPGAGKGGMVQLASASTWNVSMFVAAPCPPVIMRPAKGKLNEIQTTMVDVH